MWRFYSDSDHGGGSVARIVVEGHREGRLNSLFLGQLDLLCRFLDLVSGTHVAQCEQDGNTVLEVAPVINKPLFRSLIRRLVLVARLVDVEWLEVDVEARKDHEAQDTKVEIAAYLGQT